MTFCGFAVFALEGVFLTSFFLVGAGFGVYIFVGCVLYTTWRGVFFVAEGV